MFLFKKNIYISLFLTSIYYCKAEPLVLKPIFSTQFFSSGSIHNTENYNNTTITDIEVQALKNHNQWSILGSFKFTTASNFDLISTYTNPDLNFEHSRKYIKSENTWYESSSLLIKNKKNESFTSFFGKSNLHWSNGESSLILGNSCPSFPLIGFDWKITNKINLSYFIASLSSQIEDTTDNIYNGFDSRKLYIPRSVAGHKFDYIFSDQLKFSAMEIVIFGNRKIDENYLFPFIPFWSMQHYIGDIDNVQMCGEIIWNNKSNNLSFHSSIFIDEWRPEWTFKKQNRNWFGYSLGIEKMEILSSTDNFKFEYIWTDHRIYRHKFPINSSYTYDYPIGFWAGPHSEYLFARYFSNFNNDMGFIFSLSMLKRGKLTQEMIENQYNNILEQKPRYSGANEKKILISVNCFKYYFNKKIKAQIGTEWINWVNAGFDPYVSNIKGNDLNKFSVNLSLIAMTNLIFN